LSSFLHLLTYVRNYKLNAILNIVFNLLYVVFSTLSIGLLWPFLKVLFSDGPQELIPVAFAWNKEAFAGYLQFQFGSFIAVNGQAKALTTICISIVIVFFLKNLFRYLAIMMMASVRTGVVRDIRAQLFKKMVQLPLSYFSEKRKGDIMARMTADVQEIEWSVLNAIEAIFREPLMIIVSLSILLLMSVKLTFFVFLLLIITAVLIGGIGKTLKRKSALAQKLLGGLLSTLEETLGGLRIIKGFNAQRQVSNVFDKENDAYRDTMTKLLWRKDLSSPLSEFLGVSVFVVLLWYGAREVFAGQLEAAAFMVYLGIFYQIINPAKSFSSAYYNVQKGIAASERVGEILEAPLTIQNQESPIAVSAFNEEITFRNVSFAYDTQPVLSSINIDIKRGQTLAIVGPSGGGKSTIADLIMRFYDVNQGAIFLDGVNIQSFDIHQLRDLIGIVSQDPILFNDTIFNNIAFGMASVSKQDVMEAAKQANAHDFIMEMSKDYQTNIGDRGDKLSGGQKQRITIARALLKNPPILILDEATSSLDVASEKLVQDALMKVMKGRTAIVIAHRLSTIRNADTIIVLQNGHITEKGNHNELLALGGAYSKLAKLQEF